MPSDIDPRGTAAYRAAKLAVIILSVLILLAVAALVVGAVAKLARKSAPHGDTAAFQLAPGAKILDMQSQPGRVILRVANGGNEEVDILDTQDGHLVRQIKAGAREQH